MVPTWSLLTALSSDEDEDDDEFSEQADQHEDGPVKAEPVEANLREFRTKKKWTLKIYKPMQIKTFERDKLLGDAEYLDGGRILHFRESTP